MNSYKSAYLSCFLSSEMISNNSILYYSYFSIEYKYLHLLPPVPRVASRIYIYLMTLLNYNILVAAILITLVFPEIPTLVISLTGNSAPYIICITSNNSPMTTWWFVNTIHLNKKEKLKLWLHEFSKYYFLHNMFLSWLSELTFWKWK